MTCELCVLKLFIALRRAQPLAAALLVSAVFIGALGAAVPAMQAQQAVVAAPAGSSNAVPPPKAETPPPAESTAEILNRIANSGLPERGAHDAKVTIVFFDDFQCPYCAQMYRTLFSDVMKTYADRVRVVIRPVANSSIHPWAKHAAIDANCLAVQNPDAYWDFSDNVHGHPDQFNADSNAALDKLAMDTATGWGLGLKTLQGCLDEQPDAIIKESYTFLKPLSITGVPTIFINDQKLHGTVAPSTIRDVIDQLLRSDQPSPTRVSPELPQAKGSVSPRDMKDSKENQR